MTLEAKKEEQVGVNKGELVDAVSEKTSNTKKTTDGVISAALEIIMNKVAEGERVSLVGFGSFESRDRRAREGRNPKTGEKMEIPATKVPAFSAGKTFKDLVADKNEEARIAELKRENAQLVAQIESALAEEEEKEDDTTNTLSDAILITDEFKTIEVAVMYAFAGVGVL